MNNHESTRIDTNPETLRVEVFVNFETSKTRVEINRLMKSRPFVSIRGY